ncbi:MAG: hypothetical protein AB1801_10045 [Chloroflexota bacterium]
MASSRAFGRKKRRRRRLEDEERASSRPVRAEADRSGLAALQQQIGNRAVQQMLAHSTLPLVAGQAQRQTEDQEKAAQAPVEVGEVKIEKPQIEYYEVTGAGLLEASQQVLPPGEWSEVEYQPKPKIEHGVVVRVDLTVKITLRLPRWAEPDWQHAADRDKLAWLEMLKTMALDPDEESEEVTALPQKWLLGPGWVQASPAVKGEWQAMLQSLQSREQNPLDLARRRALVLQQRLLKQPEQQVKPIVDQFMKDLKVEQEMYNRQLEFGRKQQVSLGTNALVQ